MVSIIYISVLITRLLCIFNDSLSWHSATLGLFDTILADYLIGAVDGFSPYTQDVIVEKLSNYLKPGGKIYIIGMNPIPDTNVPPANVVSEVTKISLSDQVIIGGRRSSLAK